VIRFLAGLFFLAAGLTAPAPAAQTPQWQVTLRQASLDLREQGRATVAATLRRAPDVAGVSLGTDGRTLMVRFIRGPVAAILPASPTGQRQAQIRSAVHQSAGTGDAGRAIVLEPFATELGLGPHAGDVQAAQLERAGYSVEQLYDQAVTVAEMQTLSDYNVVDIDTHSGANQYGEGVIATGQPYTDDPSLQPWVDEYSVLPTTVAGSSQLYYGILSRFITEHMSHFPAGSLVFVNGCDLLRASAVWQALAQQGVSAMVSWDGVVAPNDAETSGNLLLADLASGMPLGTAVSAVQETGYGISSLNGATAHLGYLGAGSLMLGETVAETAATPTAPVTPTAIPVPDIMPPAVRRFGRHYWPF